MLAAFAIALSSLPGVQSIHAQSNSGEAVIKPIMGRVFDEEGEPLPGATVRIKGLPATEGALTTDANGTFGFKYDMKHGANPVLEVSYIGMQTQDVKVDFKKPLKIQLEPDALKLTEVTVVDDGYNRLPRRDMVGSYTTLKAEDVIIPGYQSIDQMLQGRVAGMVVSNSSARVGASPS
ncbi:MAG: carboxypeptidase-like regulatory domain-containing protein, partial [Duncaniella sp.]|nr:carboxypeptidase-like regulatory domain-containing protein [Duncaniella sp.]